MDKFAKRAVAEGAIVTRPLEDQSYGDRACQLKDPFGYTWMVATHKQDVSVADMQKGFDEYLAERDQPRKFKREGYRTVTPYIIAQPAVELVDFVKQAFGAVESMRGTGVSRRSTLRSEDWRFDGDDWWWSRF